MISKKEGRRGRPPCSQRPWVEHSIELDALRLGHRDPFQFLPMAETLLLLNRIPDLQSREIEVTVSGPDSTDPQPYRLTVSATSPYFGGVRQWFECPRCSRRVRKLYCIEPLRGLVYWSQYIKHPLFVMMNRARRLRPDLFPKW